MIMIGISDEDDDGFPQRQALIAAANAGDSRAQYLLAERYRIGDEWTAQDYVEAARWYRRAAEQGHPAAQNDYGSICLNGMGVLKDAAEAARWYRKAAEQGLAMAQFHYALRCLHGDGVERDDTEAVLWLGKAAEQGHVEATGQLGTCYRFARGVKRNTVLAAQLHVKAREERRHRVGVAAMGGEAQHPKR